MNFLLIGETPSRFMQIDDQYFVDLMQMRTNHLLRHLYIENNKTQAPKLIGHSILISGNLSSLEGSLREAGHPNLASTLFEEGEIISAGLLDGQGSPVRFLTPETAALLSISMKTLCHEAVPEDFRQEWSALTRLLEECVGLELCVLKYWM